MSGRYQPGATSVEIPLRDTDEVLKHEPLTTPISIIVGDRARRGPTARERGSDQHIT